MGEGRTPARLAAHAVPYSQIAVALAMAAPGPFRIRSRIESVVTAWRRSVRETATASAYVSMPITHSPGMALDVTDLSMA